MKPGLILSSLVLVCVFAGIALTDTAGPAGQDDFNKVVGTCVQCHEAQCGSIETAVQQEWIKPGNPDGSMMYTMLKDSGQWAPKMKAAVQLTEADTKVVFDYIKAMKPAAKENENAATTKASAMTPDAEKSFRHALSACAQCHRSQSQNVETAYLSGRIKPATPDKSPLYTQIKSMHMKAATGLTDADAAGVLNYIKGLKEPELAAATAGKTVWKPGAGPVWGRQGGKDPITRAIKPDAFTASFYCLSVPTGAMTSDPEEVLLRYQACDLAQQIAFLEEIAKLDLSKEQAEKLLPFARQARDMCEERADELHEQWRAYGVMCNWQRKFMVLSFKACGRKFIDDTIGMSGFCGCPAYSIGRFDKTEDFYAAMGALGDEATNAVLTDEQKEKLPDIRAELRWAELPVHERRAVIKSGGTKSFIDALGQLLLAPNAVSWLEKKAGQDSAASIERARKLVPHAAELIQLHRNMVDYDLRLVDGANVISGFNFTEKQLDSLIGIINGEMKQLHSEHAELNKKSLRPLVALLTGMRDDVEQGKGLMDEKKQRVIDLQNLICRGNYRGRSGVGQYSYTQGSLLCPVHKEYTRKMEAIFARLNGEVLYESQCRLLYDTHSCQWWPPPQYSNPVRVGQAAEPAVYPEHAVLARLRGASDAEYQVERDAFVAKVVSGTLSGRPATAAKERETDRVAGLVDSIRAMPEADYELNRFKLLAQILKKPCPEMIGGTPAALMDEAVKDFTWEKIAKGQYLPEVGSYYDLMRAMAKAGKPVPSMADLGVPYGWIEWPIFLREMPAYFLMDPDVVPSLEVLRIIERARSQANGSGQVDLDKVQGAETRGSRE